jgi:Phage integrase family
VGLPPIRLHDLRHSVASILLALGVHPKVVSDMLGHATIALTLDTYSHVLPSLQVVFVPLPGTSHSVPDAAVSPAGGTEARCRRARSDPRRGVAALLG